MLIEPPYETIWERLLEGRVIPFLGAGASLTGRPQNVAWNAARDFPPTAGELANELARASNFPSGDSRDREDLAKVGSYYVESNGRPILRSKLRAVLDRKYRFGRLHGLLARAARRKPMMIVTTNYDTLIERALDAGRVPYNLVVYDADTKSANNCVQVRETAADGTVSFRSVRSNTVDLDPTRTLVFKIHGSLNPDPRLDSFVITEEDYINFLSRFTRQTAIPSQFLDHFGQCSFLFLGYSLKDWNLRVVLNNLRQYLSEAAGGKSWSIQREVSPLEDLLWKKRDVNLYQVAIDEFAAKLVAESRRQT